MAGMMIPVLLGTAGILFLLMEFYSISIQWTWPALPLVIGAVKLLQSETPGKAHVPVGYGYTSLPRDEFRPPGVVAKTNPATGNRGGGNAANPSA